ncbi:hypothetical protein FSP39_020030 [Pinctada imbricata]|uniref:Uncharacterized protein n=1 Tax=Pinctada imbricata TaxID=66713 RepID=A0AA89C0L5_PINIB|nr:hypothetical protein FSP39_020030 [Pinctada imbricata]
MDFTSALCLLSLCLTNAFAAVQIRRVGQFSMTNAAFTNLYENKNATNPREKYDLILSSFSGNPFTGGTVEYVRGVGNWMNRLSSTQTQTLANRMSWPNEIAGVPVNIFGKRMVAVPDGFLVPFKGDGHIYLIDVSSSVPGGPYKLTDHTEGQWFYHRVVWKDMDGDGDMDILTCRAREPVISLFSSKDSELLWLENPASHSYSSPWKQHVITHGPDVYLRNLKIATPNGTFDAVVTTEFFTKKLSIHWTTDSQNRWTDSSKIHSRTIDATPGAMFDVEICDVNNDGKLDLLTTSNGNNGSVIIYEIPTDFRTQAFRRHVVATGFSPREKGTGKGAPGSSFCIHSTTGDHKNDRPLILVSGDDDGRAYIMEPTSSDSNNWSYSKRAFYDTGSGTVGQMAFADVDGDGYVDIFVPSYTVGEVLVYTFAPYIAFG